MSLPSEESGSRSLLSTRFEHAHVTSRYPIYRWKPLSDPSKQILLLSVIPSIGSQDMKCSLEIISHITSSPPKTYSALSYVWGDATTNVPMTLFEDNMPCTVYITRNLHAAIRDMTYLSGDNISRVDRDSHSPGQSFLLIDALCIDQSNDQERGMQIQIIVIYMQDLQAFQFGLVPFFGARPSQVSSK